MTRISRHDLSSSGDFAVPATPAIGWIADSDQRSCPAIADLAFISIKIDDSRDWYPDLNILVLDSETAGTTLQQVRASIGDVIGLVAVVGPDFGNDKFADLLDLGADDVARDPEPQEILWILQRLRKVVDHRRHAAAAMLAVGEERDYLQASIDSLQSPIYFKNREGLYIGFNKAFQQYLGLPPERILYASVYDVAPTSLADVYRKADEALLCSGEPQTYETPVRYADGDMRHISFHKSALRGADGQIIGLAGVMLDITDRKRLEAERDQQASRLNAAVQNMSQGLVMFGSDARLLLCNDRYVSMYGLTREQVKPGVSLLALMEARREAGTFSDDPATYCQDTVAWIAAGGKERYLDMSDGRAIRILIRPLADGGWIATHEDVTAQRLAELERDRARDFLNRIIESVPVRIVVKDARDLHYILLNKASETVLGLLPGAWVGKSSFDVFNAEMAARIETDDRIALETRQARVLPEHETQFPTGKTKVERITKVPIFDKDGEPIYLLVVAEDLTDRKSVEQQFQQAMKMEAIGNLTGGIAHDFNNLLMVMIGNLDLLVEELADKPTALEKVQLVLNSSLSGAELTRQMLAFARRQPLNPKRIQLDQLIENTGRLLKRTLGQEIAIELRAAPDVWLVHADEPQLQSALVNIAINARDAMPGGGTLIIEAHNVTIDADGPAIGDALRPGEYAVISLSDTGTGMPPEVMARIFEPFYTTKAKGKGTGLGLSMVYGFAKQSNGHINVYSELGRGTTFKLYLPRDKEHESTLPFVLSSSIVPLGGGETILAVDDNKDVLTTVARQLTDLGYNVETAGSAFSGLRMLDDGLAAHLLFSDVVMPGGLNGKDLADEVARKHPNVRVLLTSGFTGAFLANDTALNSQYRLLSKPYRKDDLARAVRCALDTPIPARSGT
jgi:PAS domain S-box-containing protein